MAAMARAYLFDGRKDAEDVKGRMALANPGSLVQVARAGAASNELLVEMLAAQTLRAESSGSMLAKKPEVDLLLRIAGTTQISAAIEGYGAAKGKRFLAINAGREALAVPEGFGESELPRKSLTKSELLRVERAALLNAQRG